jgi:hypothetical protein
MSHLNSSLCLFEPLETKLHYAPCLKNVSNTVKNRYKGNRLTVKRSTIFTGGRPLKYFQNQKNSESNKIFLARHHATTVVIMFM